MYKLQNDWHGNVCAILRIADNMSIPLDPANTDYQAYLAWVAQGNQATPADEAK
jgi:hypothetical protein